MARLIRPLRKCLHFYSSSSSSASKIVALGQQLQVQQQPHTSLLNPKLSSQSPRTYISQTRTSAADKNLVTICRNEIQYELDRLPVDQPGTEFDSFTVDDRPGEKYITLKRKFGENEDIIIEATMFNGSIPAPKSAAAVGKDDHLRYLITVVVSIYKEGSDNILEILCSSWPDFVEIKKLGTRKCKNMPSNSYFGPGFKELDDELDDALYEFLEERGINDELAVFLHNFMKNKEKTEYIRWIETLKYFIEKK